MRAYDIQAAIVPRTTCESDQQPGSTTTKSEGGVARCGCVIRCRRLPCRFPDRARLSAQKGDRLILEMRPKGAALTSPPEGVLRHMRHQELWRAVGTHYGPTLIYGLTGHAIGGTAQQALRELLPQLSQPDLGTISDNYGPAAIRRSKDFAAAAGARATRMSRLWACDAAGGRGPERRHATGPTTMRPQGAGRRVSPGALDSECSASQLDAACAEYLSD